MIARITHTSETCTECLGTGRRGEGIRSQCRACDGVGATFEPHYWCGECGSDCLGFAIREPGKPVPCLVCLAAMEGVA